jgi:hypothetical protein
MHLHIKHHLQAFVASTFEQLWIHSTPYRLGDCHPVLDQRVFASYYHGTLSGRYRMTIVRRMALPISIAVQDNRPLFSISGLPVALPPLITKGNHDG